ncbi:MAG: hypothetical protein JO022_14995 [Acidobacteriaceae bacterium]|nr:hypothetical protein [Acidobacteriaceae bacterium]
MALINTGLTNAGVTTHYRFFYDEFFGGAGGVEPARTNAVIQACEDDFTLLSNWFGGTVNVAGLAVDVTTQAANTCGAAGRPASNGGCWRGSTVQLIAQGPAYANDPVYLRYLMIAEVSEIFMMKQNAGWFQGKDEGSKGEGLSRFLSSQFLAQNGYLGLGIDSGFAVASLWLNSSREDFVNNDPDDNRYDAVNGCTTLFIYYLFHQLGFSINQIVAAGAPTLAGVYRNLTGDSSDPFSRFKQLLDLKFPSQTGNVLPGPNFDDPWPIDDSSFTEADAKIL